MAADTRKQQHLTMAEVCQAIEAGQVQYSVKDGHYQVTRGELSRLRAAREHETIPLELLHFDDASADMGYRG